MGISEIDQKRRSLRCVTTIPSPVVESSGLIFGVFAFRIPVLDLQCSEGSGVYWDRADVDPDFRPLGSLLNSESIGYIYLC